MIEFICIIPCAILATSTVYMFIHNIKERKKEKENNDLSNKRLDLIQTDYNLISLGDFNLDDCEDII